MKRVIFVFCFFTNETINISIKKLIYEETIFMLK